MLKPILLPYVFIYLNLNYLHVWVLLWIAIHINEPGYSGHVCSGLRRV